ncbi:hypothetical protein IKL64_01045 [bacterium]|nr:hypothetical protein [bacterium]
MKILPLFIEEIPHVKIARCLEEADPASLALDKLLNVQPMLEGYAKAHNVDLFVQRTAKNKTHEQPQYVRNITDNIISLTVQNRDGSNRQMTNFVVHPWKDSYIFQKSKEVDLIDFDGKAVKKTVSSHYEDNFIRAFFRTFEDLVKVVKSQD